MKKILFIVAAIAALAFTSCGKDKENGLGGSTWVYRLEPTTDTWVNISLSFHNNGTVDMNAEYMIYGEYEKGSVKGMYTYVAPNITLTFTDEDGEVERMTGTITDNKMLLREADDPQAGSLAFLRK